MSYETKVTNKPPKCYVIHCFSKSVCLHIYSSDKANPNPLGPPELSDKMIYSVDMLQLFAYLSVLDYR